MQPRHCLAKEQQVEGLAGGPQFLSGAGYLDQLDGVIYPWRSRDGNQTTEYCINVVAMEQTNQAIGFVCRVRHLAVP